MSFRSNQQIGDHGEVGSHESSSTPPPLGSWSGAVSIALCVLQLPWAYATALLAWFIFGDNETTRTQSIEIGACMRIPCALAVLTGAFALFRRYQAGKSAIAGLLGLAGGLIWILIMGR